MPEVNFPEMMRDRISAAREDEAKKLIEEWVKKGRTEDLYLDFTTKKDPSKGLLDQDDKRGFAKAISGFANSDGGLLVWGVVAKKEPHDPEAPDKARASKVISPLNTFRGELNALVAESTKPAVSGVVNLPIWKSRRANSGWVVSYMPVGTSPPYRAENGNNNHFYKRAGSRFYHMEPYDIRDVVFRFRYPKIQLDMFSAPALYNNAAWALIVKAANAGPSALREWKMQLDMPDFVVRTNEDIDYDHRRIDAMTLDRPIARWEAYSTQRPPERWVIYPGEERMVVGPEGVLHMELVVPPEGWKRIDEAGEAGWQGGEVVCRLFGGDMPPVEIRKPLRELASVRQDSITTS